MRGMDEKYTLVMIDGVRQNDPSESKRIFNFEHVVVHNIERIEIVRGPQAGLYGSNASGGVINIITKRGAQEGFAGSVKAEYGSYATRRLDADVSYGGKVGDVPFRLAYAHSEYMANGPSIADKHYVTPSGKSQATEDDRTIIYAHSLNAEISPTEDVRGRVFFSVSDLSADIDGTSGSVPIDKDRQKDKRVYSYGTSWDVDTLDDRLLHKVQVSVMQSRTDRYYHDGTTYAAYNDHYLSSYGQTVQLDYQGTYVVNDNHKVTFGTTWDSERYKKHEKDWTESIDAQQFHTSVMAQLQSDFLNDALHVNIGMSYDMFSSTNGKATYRGGVSYTVPVTETILKASAGTGFMTPTLYNLYRYENPDVLDPEEALLFDVGFEQPLFKRRVTIGATAFKNKIKNEIIYKDDATCTGSTTYCYVNRDKMSSKGIEAEIRAMAYEGETDSLELSSNYTYTYAEDNDGAEIDRVPRHNLGVSAMYAFNEDKGMFRVDGQYNGRRTDNYAKQRIRAGGEWKFDLAAQYEVYDDVTAYARAENILDADFSTSTGYESSPRAFYVGLGYKF